MDAERRAHAGTCLSCLQVVLKHSLNTHPGSGYQLSPFRDTEGPQVRVTQGRKPAWGLPLWLQLHGGRTGRGEVAGTVGCGLVGAQGLSTERTRVASGWWTRATRKAPGLALVSARRWAGMSSVGLTSWWRSWLSRAVPGQRCLPACLCSARKLGVRPAGRSTCVRLGIRLLLGSVLLCFLSTAFLRCCR